MTQTTTLSHDEHWPDLPLSEWADTCATLHLWTQIVGKIRLAHAPLINHWWQVPLYVTSRGLTTSRIDHGSRSFEIDFDFIGHTLILQVGDGAMQSIPLAPRSVADFYTELMSRLRSLGLETRIWTMPVEIPDAVPFDRDAIRKSASPDEDLLAFLQSTYDAAADLAHWDRAALERAATRGT